MNEEAENPSNERQAGTNEIDTGAQNSELKELVREIFKIIPSYYDKSEAEQIELLIKDYVEKQLKQRR